MPTLLMPDGDGVKVYCSVGPVSAAALAQGLNDLSNVSRAHVDDQSIIQQQNCRDPRRCTVATANSYLSNRHSMIGQLGTRPRSHWSAISSSTVSIFLSLRIFSFTSMA